MRAVLAVLIVSSVAHADDGIRASAPVKEASPHLVYVEALGKGGLYGVGYERALLPWLSLGGAGSWSALRGQHVTTLAPYAHATVLGRGHHALFGELGAIVARSSIASPVMDWDGLTTWGGGGFANLGYEHASRHVVLRASAGVVVGRGGAQPMVGFAIGARP
jgi:hypothetical protein